MFLLSGLTFKIRSILEEKSKRSRAQTELSILAQALETYKENYGDYPWIESDDGANELFRSLIGNRSPLGSYQYDQGSLKSIIDPLSEKHGVIFVTLSHFSLNEEPITNVPQTVDANLDNAFIDPWGLPYAYQYKKIEKHLSRVKTWQRFGYLLMSHGPDKDDSLKIPPTGLLENFFKNPASRDNIFSE